jgi:hypothetical protein
MVSSVRRRFWLEAGTASLCGALAALTLLWRAWLEAMTGFDPDGGNGSFEWALVAGLFLVCAAAAASTGREWRRRSGALTAEG